MWLYLCSLALTPLTIMTRPPVILPRSPMDRPPRWSVMIPVYNCLHFLTETIQSVLDQDPGESKMQIEVVDDGSTDGDVASLVERIGKGRVRYYRHAENQGSLKTFETCLQRSIGDIVHLLHGDDLVVPGFYAKMDQLFASNPEAGAAFCRYSYIGENGGLMWYHSIEGEEGVIDDFLIKIASKQRTQYCATVVLREVYEKVGGFYGVTYGEDWEMWARIAKNYPVAYTPEVLANYRMHNTSISSKSFLSAKNLEDIKWVVDKIQEYVPEHQRAMVRREAFRHYAHYALSVANSLWHETQNRQITRQQILGARRMHSDLIMYYKILKIYTKMAIGWV